MEYDPENCHPQLFVDLRVSHNHGKLLDDDSFKKLINDTEKRTGFTFQKCSGGFGYKFDYELQCMTLTRTICG